MSHWGLGRLCVETVVSPQLTDRADNPALLQARTGASCSIMCHQDLCFSSTIRFLHLLKRPLSAQTSVILPKYFYFLINFILQVEKQLAHGKLCCPVI